MAKEFNITGACFPEDHYMADVSKKLEQVYTMVEKGSYFIINRPRQYGKTTTLFTIANHYRQTKKHLVFNMSFEGLGDTIFQEEELFASGFIRLLAKHIKTVEPKLSAWLLSKADNIKKFVEASDLITELADKTPKKLILLIDEVDKSSNNQLFVSFLAMLRNKYLARKEEKTFHAVVLAGVHDVKSLKLKLRPDEEAKFNSPWNIAAEFKVDMNLQPFEIKPMLAEYMAETGVKMDVELIAHRLFYYTSGYPFLVSKLCKMLDEDIVKNGEWTSEDIDAAVRVLVTEKNTNFDTLTKNLKNNPELYNLVYQIAIDNDIVPFNAHNELTDLGITLGLFKSHNGAGLRIHNRIYAEVIYNYMSLDVLISTFPASAKTKNIYKNDNGSLNMETVLLGFQTFMKKEYSKKDRDFLEKNGRLVFLAFLKPIINGLGYDFKEPQVSEERRLDVVITYLKQKFVAELKIWRGEKAHEKGLVQLHDYLDSQNLNEGYLLIFDHSEVKKWHSEWVDIQGKKIFIVWV